MPGRRMSHESDSASRHRNMLKSLQVDIPHVGATMPAIGFVRQPRRSALRHRTGPHRTSALAPDPTARVQRAFWARVLFGRVRQGRARDRQLWRESHGHPDALSPR
jgi:hypothetical protein